MGVKVGWVFLCLAALSLTFTVIVALPTSTGDGASKQTKDPKHEEVSWQSIFWGLFALALQAMAIPSILDGDASPTSLLLPARASPFVCFTDIVETLLVFASALKITWSLQSAASLYWLWHLEHRYGADNQEYPALLTAAIRVHPKTALVLFLGIVTQFVKLLGFQGIFWAKIFATVYFTAYIVPAALLLMADPRYSWDELSPMEYYSLPKWTRPFFSGLSIAASLILCCWALGGIAFQDGSAITWSQADKTNHTFGNVMLLAGLFLSEAILTILRCAGCACFFGFLVFIVINLYEDNKKAKTPTEHFRATMGCLGQAAIDLVLSYYSVPWIWHTPLSAKMRVALNSPCLLLIVLGIIYVLTRVWDIATVRILRAMEKPITSKWTPHLTILAVAFLVISIVYCAYAFQTTGTIKPDWTEALG